LPEPDGPSSARDDLARIDIERDIAQGIDAGLTLAEMLGNAVETNQRAAWISLTMSAPSAVAGSTLSAARTPRPLDTRQNRDTISPRHGTLSGSSTHATREIVLDAENEGSAGRQADEPERQGLLDDHAADDGAVRCSDQFQGCAICFTFSLVMV